MLTSSAQAKNASGKAKQGTSNANSSNSYDMPILDSVSWDMPTFEAQKPRKEIAYSCYQSRGKKIDNLPLEQEESDPATRSTLREYFCVDEKDTIGKTKAHFL